MQRRQFLASSLAASALAVTRQSNAQAATPAKAGEYYQLRRYQLQNGPQTKLTQAYFADALIPALSRMGMGPVGAFSIDIGPEEPGYYLLIPSPSLDTLVNVDFHLADDAAFMKAAEPFWGAPAQQPAFQRVESSLLSAFACWPKLTPPPGSGNKEKRVFQLRQYESPSMAAHVRKVEMFNHGEPAIFEKAGFHSVFYADTLIGPRLPNLTYMLSGPDTAHLLEYWTAFAADPDWKKLSGSSRYNYEEIVSNITSLILKPLDCSQI
jgi:hypothetical protein